MKTRKELLDWVEQLSDEQLANLSPLALSIIENQSQSSLNQTSDAYKEWVSAENDVYDTIFANELAAR
jgi:hypothetical protein